MVFIPTLLAAASLAAAIPTATTRDEGTNFNYIIDPWKDGKPPQKREAALAEAAMEFIARDDIPADPNAYQGYIPGCDPDPSYEIPANTKYGINQGVKVPKLGKDDACTTGHNAAHCWTEYWMVETAIEYTGWRIQGSGIDCATTSSCDAASTITNQTCTLTGSTTQDGYDWKIFEGTLNAEFDFKLINVGLGASSGTSIQHSTTEQNAVNVCVSSQDGGTCTWDDKKCHQLWVADRMLHVWGYRQRVCNGGAKSHVQIQTTRNDGKSVHGLSGFDFYMPINTLQGCGALCADREYEAPLPSAGPRTPFPTPAGW